MMRFSALAMLLIAMSQAPAWAQVDPYANELTIGYQLLMSGSPDSALPRYRQAAILAADAEKRMVALTGAQDCLMLLKNYEQASAVGHEILAGKPDDSYVLINTGWADLYQKRYDEAAAMFRRVHQQDSTNIDALEGLAWAHYHLGQKEMAQGFLKRARAAGTSAKPSLDELERALAARDWSLSLGLYGTHTNYTSNSKKHGRSMLALLSGQYKQTHRVSVSFSAPVLSYVTTGTADLDEENFLAGYEYTGPWSFTGNYKHVATEDKRDVLGYGYLVFARAERNGWFAQGSYSDYEKIVDVPPGPPPAGAPPVKFRTNAIQGGGGYRWTFKENYTLSSRVEWLQHNQITPFMNGKSYMVFSQEHHWRPKPWARLNLDYSLGNSALFVSRDGYLLYNATDVLKGSGHAGVTYVHRDFEIGYELGYVRGDHISPLAPSPFSSISNTLKLICWW